MQWRVLAEESGLRLLSYLKGKLPPNYSTRVLKGLLESNCCSLNGKFERFGSVTVATGDLIALQSEVAFDALPASSASTASSKIANSRRSFPLPAVLFEDDHFLFIDKPVGVSSDDPILRQHKGAAESPLILLHRLDKGTSGVLALGKDLESARAMEALFRKRAIQKKYMAIVSGIVKNHSGSIEIPLAKLGSYQGQVMWGAAKAGGLVAVTKWNVLARGATASLLACYPLTGRTHQIRVHLSLLGAPIVGDTQYGQKMLIYAAKRPLLHASELSFVHPFTSKPVLVSAEWPLDFKLALEALNLKPRGSQ